jgi:hypothetical protein|tara:strand:+ start:379 stop:573 length:195 start_codon:yes stop_codon:yes gene_type:complete
MSKVPRGLVSKTIFFVSALSGDERTRYIEEILDDYYWIKSQRYPKATVKKFYELFTKLVKKFGH